MLDPPSGWRYGFPKPIPEEYLGVELGIRKWLLLEGYPQEIIDQFPDGVPCRCWEEENG